MGRTVRRRLRHRGRTRVAYSADGQLIASATSDGEVRVRETRELKTRRTEKFEDVRDLQFHPEGRHLLVADTPDGQTIAFPGDDRKTLEIWNWREQRLVRTLVGHRQTINRIEFDPRGRYLASAGSGYGEFLLWDLSTGAIVDRMGGGSNFSRRNFTFSPGGERLIASHAGEVAVYDLGRDRLDPLARGAVMRWAWDPSRSLHLGPDGRLLLRAGHRIELLHFGQGRELTRFSSADGEFSTQPESARLSADGQTVFLTSETGNVRLHDLATGAASAPLRTHEHEMAPLNPREAIHPSPDGTRLYAASRYELRLWRLDGDEPRLESSLRSEFASESHHLGFGSLGLSPDGRLLAVSELQRRVQILSSSDLRPLSKIDVFRGLPRFHPHRPELACVDIRSLRVVDVSDPSSPRELYRVSIDEPAILEYSPDGSLLALAIREGIELRDAATGAHLKTLPAGQAQSLSVSPNGRWIVSGGERAVTLWDIESGERVGTFGGHSGVVTFISFTPDGKRFVSRCETTVCVWDLQDLLDTRVDYAQQLEDLEWGDGDIRDRSSYAYVSSNLGESVVSPMRPGPANALPELLRREADPETQSRDLFWRYLRAGSAVSARYLLGELRELTSEADVRQERDALIDLYLGRAQSEGTSSEFQHLQVRFALELDPENPRAKELAAQLGGE